ncbi:MAG: histidine phosphatase family protein, partial [Thermus sp.]
GVVRAVLRALGEDGLVPPGHVVVVDWPHRVLDGLG